MGSDIVSIETALSIAGRTVLFYLLVLVVIRLMGKREVGRLSPIDLVVAIMIAEAAVIAIEEPQVPLLAGIVPVVVLFLAEFIVSRLSLKYEGLRRIVADKPSVIIRQGTLDIEQMRRERYNLDDLMEQLRLKGFSSPADVEFAVLETSGGLSVIPKANKRPVSPADLGIQPEPAGLPAVLIADGHIEADSLGRIHRDERWLKGELANRGFSSPEELFVALYLPDGQLFLHPRKAPPKETGETENTS